MHSNPSANNPEAAFNLTELCVVIGCVAVIAVLILPALGASKTQSASAGCLYNLRHLQTGCAMYSTDNNDYLMPNSPLGNYPAGWVSPAAENWAAAPANIDPTYYTNSKSLMWPYLNNNLSVFRCPGDMVPSANGTRIRSYSMNGSVLGGLQGNITPLIGYNVGYRVYIKGGDLIQPSPANLFVFADESPASLNDGYLQMGLISPLFPDIPACYLEGGCGFSFADGHGEIHRWQTSALKIPIRQGYTAVNVTPINGIQNVDWLWLRQHASSK
jgi:type II secretory pathway pseudopilin PulG